MKLEGDSKKPQSPFNKPPHRIPYVLAFEMVPMNYLEAPISNDGLCAYPGYPIGPVVTLHIALHHMH